MKKILCYITCYLWLINTAVAEEILRMATTTSTENSGLLSVLNPPFEQKTGVKVHVIAVGTGQALRHAENGDVDLVFVHDPEAEKRFVEFGHGIERKPVMHNDFILLGPQHDPAHAGDAASISEAMENINESKITFISRGDDSGTHQKELKLWQMAGLEPKGDWYLSVGQGMGPVLTMANEMKAYTLSDRGTYLAYSDKINLKIVFENAKELDNPYHIILVNPETHPQANVNLARKYLNYITGEEGQNIIRGFRIKDQQLFYPDVIK
ncbi:MAG: substrate-binding domain-containing protein [Gammaproteobacteria bacterium]|nr:substrate-binding domain-containing protein [Gammaproteobacteria bacterium]